MKRTKKTPTPLGDYADVFDEVSTSQASAILTADWHLREDTPTCRTDDFWTMQWRVVDEVAALQKKLRCPVLHAGDLFHHWKASPRLLSYAIRYLPDQFYTVYGQHDLPQHNLDLQEKSGIYTLKEAGKVKLLDGHWGTDPNKLTPFTVDSRGVLVWHHLTYLSKPFPGASGGMAQGLLRKYSLYDLILTGDNHQAFVTAYKDQLLVNPGNLTRQSASQKDFKPRVYIWDADRMVVEPFYLSDNDPDTVSRQHIESKEERDERIEAFIERLDADWETALDFKENIRRLCDSQKIDDDIIKIVYKALEE